MSSRFLPCSFVFTCLFIVLLYPFSGRADESPSFPKIYAVFDPQGPFGFCAAAFPQDDGRKITIALSATQKLDIALTIPNAGFVPKQFYEIDLAPDGKNPTAVRVEAVKDDTVVTPQTLPDSFIEPFRTSSSLHSLSGTTRLVFQTPNLVDAFKEIDRCITSNKDKENPALQKEASDREALPPNLLFLLEKAGFTDLVPVGMNNVPPDERPADYAWTTGHLMGGVRERLIPENENIETLLALHLKGLKTKCNGVFKASLKRGEQQGKSFLRKAEAACTRPDKNNQSVFVALLFYQPSDQRFTVFTQESLLDYQQEALEARDKIGQALMAISKDPSAFVAP